ncbi:MAG TPA: hypothetical protein PKD53_04945 [Chloroflexaceae bacterium]|nr:hypothetical protein [Chloroflexaceae bacterium]
MLSLTPSADPTFSARQILDLLERHRGRSPSLDEELRHCQALHEAMLEQSQRAEGALAAWQAALARRWSCEVAAQRAYRTVQSRLEGQSGDAPYGPLVAPAQPGAASTPRALLAEVRRLEAALELVVPRPPFADEATARLRAVGDDLAAAIAQTDSCEAQRRSVVSEQRVVASLLERSHQRARQLLARDGSAPPPGDAPA